MTGWTFKHYPSSDVVCTLGPAAIRRLTMWCGDDWIVQFTGNHTPSFLHMKLLLAMRLPITVTRYVGNKRYPEWSRLTGSVGPILMTESKAMCGGCGHSADLDHAGSDADPDEWIRSNGMAHASIVNEGLVKHRKCFDYHAYLSSDAWRSVRNAALARDGARCVLCGSCRRLEVHHINYASIGHETSDDLLTLCDKCHADVEGRTEAEKTEAA